MKIVSLATVLISSMFILTKQATIRPKSKRAALTCPLNCMLCDRDSNCSKCHYGFYLDSSSQQCLTRCENGLLADNISRTCMEKKDKPLYFKSFSKGKCLNTCGEGHFDCNCDSDCVYRGNCCGDYSICQASQEDPTAGDCVRRDSSGKCVQCKESLYLSKGICVRECGDSMVVLQENRLCITKDGMLVYLACGVRYCSACEQGKCVECSGGKYLYLSTCSDSCPIGFHAHNGNYTCIDPKDETQDDKAYFYGSRQFDDKCMDRCGLRLGGCSCDVSCLRKGNCCYDFIDHCKGEAEKERCRLCVTCEDGRCVECKGNAGLENGRCDCLEGFAYDIFQDICVRGSEKSRVGLGIH